MDDIFKKSEKLFVKFVKIGIGLALFTPLVLGPFGLNMSEYPKAVFFRSIIEIVFLFYIFLVLINPAYLPKKSVLLFSIIFFNFILIVASIFGVNFFRSFFGETQRGEGIIIHLHLLAFFIIIISLFRKREDWMWLFKTTVIVSSLSSFAAILQQLKIFKFYNVESARLSGTLSNPDLFGYYLVLSIFLAIFLLVSEQKRNFKFFWGFLIILNFYALVFSGTRASWVGLALGIVSIYFFNFKGLSYKKKIYSVLIILFIFALVFIFPVATHKLGFQNSPLFQRILSLYNPFALGNRLEIWKTSLLAIKDRPILGWGFESFSFVYDKYLKTSSLGGVYFDRPHDKLLEILIYSGAMGLISYFLIFFALFYLIFKYVKLLNGQYKKENFLCSVIFAFFISGFVQNIFGFDHIGTYVLFFLAAGFVNNNFPAAEDLKEKIQQVSARKVVLGTCAFVFMIFVLYQVNIKPTAAAMYFPEYIRYEASDPGTALDGYKKGIDMKNIYSNDLVLAFTDRSIFMLENKNLGEKALEGLLEVRNILYKDIKGKDERPNNVYEYLLRADEWSYIVRKDPSYLSQMQTDVSNAIAFNPNVPVFYQLKGEMEILQDKNSQGEKDIEKGCQIDYSACSNNQAESYKRIGIAYYKKSDYKSAIKNFQNALDADYNSRKNNLPYVLSNPQPFVDSVAIMYYSYFKDFASCQKVYQRAMDVYPQYKDIFQQHLYMVTTDYEQKK